MSKLEYRVKGFTSARSSRTDFPAGTLVGITRGGDLTEVLLAFERMNDEPWYGPYDHPFVVRSDGAMAAIVDHATVSRFSVGDFRV